jgi:hypothetical protein
LFPAFVAKMRQALTFSATIGADVNPMKTITVIAILALLTISGAVISDQIRWGTTNMLSVDQFLRLISVPAVVAAFLIASQVSGAGIFRSSPPQYASE